MNQVWGCFPKLWFAVPADVYTSEPTLCLGVLELIL
jgi:hypothetical protein